MTVCLKMHKHAYAHRNSLAHPDKTFLFKRLNFYKTSILGRKFFYKEVSFYPEQLYYNYHVTQQLDMTDNLLS